MVVWTEHSGMIVEEIIRGYPGLASEKIAAALEYFHLHRDEFERDMKEDDEYADSIVEGPHVSVVRRIRKADVGTVPNSSG